MEDFMLPINSGVCQKQNDVAPNFALKVDSWWLSDVY